MNQKMLAKAIALAAEKFSGKFDKQGVPYFMHCMSVMQNLCQADEELHCIAILHDIIEDTDVTSADLTDIGMTERVINAVCDLTHVPGESYEKYIALIKTNEDARQVKLADLEHNSDITRLKGIGQKDIERMQRYHWAYTYLQNV